MLRFRRLSLLGLMVLLLSLPFWAQEKSKVDLEPNETLFTVLTALGTCGYNSDVTAADPIRFQVFTSIEKAIEKSPEAGQIKQQLCGFYKEHQIQDPTRDVSKYISLVLNVGPPPDFKLKAKEADLPPDVGYVLGFVPLMAKFYVSAGLDKIWQSVLPQYEAEVQKVHEPLANMMLNTDVYLKMPISGYVGRSFIIYIEPMAGPGKVNARVYGDDYYLVASLVNGALPMEPVRHTYLHFVLDPLAQKHPTAMRRVEPILKEIQNAPLDDVYKNDISTLVTECLIRAIEARSVPGGKSAEPKREKEVAEDMSSGFVFTRYFYEQLVKFEQEPVGLKTAFPDWMFYLDLPKWRKVAQETQFTSKPTSEVVKSTSAKTKGAADPLDLAEQKMSNNDLVGAEKLAQQVASSAGPDAARAYLVLGKIAAMDRNRDSAIQYFEQTLRTAKDPGLIAWAHIYLGRIYDVEQERDLAVKHYQAALQSGDDTPQIQAAAKKGLDSAYDRSAPPQQDKQ